MPENRYLTYLEGTPNEEYLGRNYRREEERRQGLIKPVVTGLLIAGGALAVASRSGLLDYAARLVDTHGRAAVRTLGEWQATHTPLRLERDVILQNWQEVRQGFQKSLSLVQEERSPYWAEQVLSERQRLLKHVLPFEWAESMRFMDIRSAVMQQFPQAEVERLLLRIPGKDLTAANLDFLRELNRREGFGLEEDVLGRIAEIMSPYQQKNYLREFRPDIGALRFQMQKFMDDQLERILGLPRRGPFSVLTGRRVASINEVLQSDLPVSQALRNSLAELVKERPRFGDLTFDPHVLITEGGKVVDWRPFADVRLGFMRWMEPTLPGRLLHFRDFLEMHHAPPFYLLRRGTLHPVLTGKAGEDALLGQAFVVAGRRIAPLMAPGQPLEREFQLVSGQYGLTERLIRGMADIGVTRKQSNKWYDVGLVGKVRRLLDFGDQEAVTVFRRLRSGFTKFGDESWMRNVVEGALKPGAPFDVETVKQLRHHFESTTPSMSRRGLAQLLEAAELDYDLSSLDDVNALVQHLAKVPGASEQIARMAKRVSRNPRALLDDLYILSGRPRKKALEGLEVAYREIGKELAAVVGFGRSKEILDEALKAKKLYRGEYWDALQVINASMFERAARGIDVPEIGNEAAERVHALFRSPQYKRFQEETLAWAKHNYPIFSQGPMRMPTTLGQRYTPVSRASLGGAFQDIKERNDHTRLKAFLRQFVAGRGNLQDVTFLTIAPLSPYHLLYRLSEGLGELGFGFSGRSTASALDLYLSFALKRFLPVVAGIEAFKYLDWETDNLTGYSLSERWMRTVVRTRLALAQEDVDRQKHIYSAYPYLEQMAYWPLPSMPFIGAAVSYPLFGISPVKPRSREELEEYYASGYQEVRRGRFWAFGSRTPWWGNKVDYYLPNEYAMTMSDWQYSSTLYPGDTYWRYNWLPTPRFPLAPLNRLLNPYWFEKIHYHDRPYPMTGPMFEELTPWGPILNATIGQIIKPQRMMHREEVMAALNGWPPEAPAPADAAIAGQSAVRARHYRVNQDIRARAVGVVRGGEIVPYAYVPLEVEPGGTASVPAGAVDQVPGQGVPVRGSVAARRTAVLNQGIRQRGEFVAMYGYPQEQTPLGSITSPTSLQYRLGQMQYMVQELAGIYGFMSEAIAGEPFSGVTTWQSAQRAYGLEQRFWESNLGGLGGALSEIGRRFLPHRMRYIHEFNPIPNQMPPWLPGADYFINYRLGDPYAAIPFGEVRLPGEAYERTHVLHPDAFGRYGAVDRAMILADVAPYSVEYRFWSQVATHMDLPDDVRHQLAEAKRRASAVKRDHTFYPYHFRDLDLQSETVHVTHVLDLGMFLTAEYPFNPIRVAGVRAQSLNRDELSRVLFPGQAVRIAYDPDNKISDDTYNSIRAVVTVGGQNLGRFLIEQEMAAENLNDWSAAGVASRFTPGEIAKARFFERLAHIDTPLHTKFLNVRSPLESYIRDQVYGEEWGDWKKPWSHWIEPTYQAFIVRNPFLAAVSGAGTGYVLGQFVMGRRGRAGAVIGGALTLAGSLYRMASEAVTGETWIPERVREEREIEEYFDILSYLKYHGLYEYAARQAAREGVDVEGLIEEAQADLQERKKRREQLERQKRRIYLRTKDRNHPEIKEINRELRALEESSTKYVELTPWAASALYYRQKYLSTVYGYEPGVSYSNIMRALPASDREYFPYFAEAPEEERRRILELIPENQRRIYQSLWGLPMDRRRDLTEYFQTHYLPPPDWPGWRPEVSLEDIKVKVVQNEALDLAAFDIWPSDEERVAYTNPPVIRPDEVRPYGPFLAVALRRILAGRGLRNVDVQVAPGPPGVSVEFDYIWERDREIEGYLANNMDEILAS